MDWRGLVFLATRQFAAFGTEERPLFVTVRSPCQEKKSYQSDKSANFSIMESGHELALEDVCGTTPTTPFIWKGKEEEGMLKMDGGRDRIQISPHWPQIDRRASTLREISLFPFSGSTNHSKSSAVSGMLEML